MRLFPNRDTHAQRKKLQRMKKKEFIQVIPYAAPGYCIFLF